MEVRTDEQVDQREGEVAGTAEGGLTMAEYIDREALCVHCGAREINACSDECEVFNAPAADVVKVVRGRWEKVLPSKSAAKWSTKVSCSVCHRSGYTKYNFCPSCGCLMGGD